MKHTELKELIRQVVKEESDYQQLFKHMLDRTGKSIPDMSDAEKVKFFTAVDKATKAKSEGKLTGYNEAELSAGQNKLDVDKDGDIGSDDLADLRAGKKVSESVIKEKSYPSFADPLEGFPTEYKELLKKLQRSNNEDERTKLIDKMNIIRKNIKLKPLTNESLVNKK